MSHSIDFNVNTQKYLSLVNNIEKISNNDKFYFSDIFEKFEYTSNYKTKKRNIRSISLLNNKSTATENYKFKYKLLGELKRKFAFTLYNKFNNYSLSNQRSLNLFLRSFMRSQKLVSWKLLSNFYSKNIPMLKDNLRHNTRIGQIDKFTLNIDSYDADDYTFRIYEKYTSFEYFKNSNTLINKFMSEYRFYKKLRSRKRYVNNNIFEENSNLVKGIYPHFFRLTNLENLNSNLNNLKNSSSVICITAKPSFTFFNHKNYKFVKKDMFICQKSIFQNRDKSLSPVPSLDNISKKYHIANCSNFIFLDFFKEISNINNVDLISVNKNPYIDNLEDTVYTLVSKSGSSFIIQHIGLFIHFKLFFFKPKFSRFKFKFKKKIFSFYKTNEIKKSLMENRKSLHIFKYINSKNWRLNKRSEYEYSNYSLNLDFYLKKKLELKSLSSLKFTHKSYMSNLTGYNRSTADISYTDSLKRLTPDVINSELRIPRLRFNPGYQRLWREYRLALANAIRFKYIYQKQLTRYLVKFYSFLKSYNILALEYKIWKIIIYSRLLPDLHSIKDFMSNSLLFLNGTVLKNENHIIAVNDIVQIQVSVWYYIYYKWLMSWNNLRIKKFKKLVYRKKIASSYTIIKSLKQKSKYTPAYIYNMRFDMSDTKSYIEVDYFTLSFILIYDNFILDFNQPDDFPEMRHYVYRMYNWKYIN